MYPFWVSLALKIKIVCLDDDVHFFCFRLEAPCFSIIKVVISFGLSFIFFYPVFVLAKWLKFLKMLQLCEGYLLMIDTE